MTSLPVSVSVLVLLLGAELGIVLTLYVMIGCRQRVGSSVVTVAVTPDGYADAVCEGVFVTPAERQMTFSQFLDIIDQKVPTNGIVYIQKQNSNFTDEFSELSDDIELQMPWATQTFGK